MKCKVCDTDIPTPGTRCTNGVCLDCHRRYCSPGGATYPGHVLTLAQAKDDWWERQLKERVK